MLEDFHAAVEPTHRSHTSSKLSFYKNSSSSITSFESSLRRVSHDGLVIMPITCVSLRQVTVTWHSSVKTSQHSWMQRASIPGNWQERVLGKQGGTGRYLWKCFKFQHGLPHVLDTAAPSGSTKTTLHFFFLFIFLHFFILSICLHSLLAPSSSLESLLYFLLL